MAKRYFVKSGYCAEQVSEHASIGEALIEARFQELFAVRGGYYVWPFIFTSDSEPGCDGFSPEERQLVEEAGF